MLPNGQTSSHAATPATMPAVKMMRRKRAARLRLGSSSVEPLRTSLRDARRLTIMSFLSAWAPSLGVNRQTPNRRTVGSLQVGGRAGPADLARLCGPMDAFEIPELDPQPRDADGHGYVDFFSSSLLSVGLAVWPAGSVDRQQPHREDE